MIKIAYHYIRTVYRWYADSFLFLKKNPDHSKYLCPNHAIHLAKQPILQKGWKKNLASSSVKSRIKLKLFKANRISYFFSLLRRRVKSGRSFVWSLLLFVVLRLEIQICCFEADRGTIEKRGWKSGSINASSTAHDVSYFKYFI